MARRAVEGAKVDDATHLRDGGGAFARSFAAMSTTSPSTIAFSEHQADGLCEVDAGFAA